MTFGVWDDEKQREVSNYPRFSSVLLSKGKASLRVESTHNVEMHRDHRDLKNKQKGL